MRRFALALTILFSVGIIGGCADQTNKPTSAPDDPATEPAKLEAKFQNETESDGEMRTEARRAVLDFVKGNLSNWNVRGMSAQLFYTNVFSVDADLERDGRHIVITFETRKFFPESGDPYWLAVPVNKFRQRRLDNLNDAQLLKQLRDAQDQLEQLRSPPDAEPE